MNPDDDTHAHIRQYYDDIYYREASIQTGVSAHLRHLAHRLGVKPAQRVLDIGCGLGQWLLAAREHGAVPSGIDLSGKAIEVCRSLMPEGEFIAGPAEQLPFPDSSFHLVTCLGSLEHFLEPEQALREMVRVALPNARILLLVPNAGFLTRRLGLYRGTEQRVAMEHVRSLEDWNALFCAADLRVVDRWRDLHVLSWAWIARKGILQAPLRAAQALALGIWPLSWQYQVYHLCVPGLSSDSIKP